MEKPSIKENVVFILKSKGMTQLQLADRLGVSKQTIQHLLNGNITLERLFAIADALNTTPAELVANPPLAKRKSFVEKGEPTHANISCPACGKILKLTLE